MGLLDSWFGSGQQQQPQQGGIPPDTFWDRFRAQYAPGAYAAHQNNLQQQAIYAAALKTQGMTPEIAQALAMSPQYFQAQQGTQLGQAPQMQIITNSDGSQTPVQIGHPGGGPGQSLTLSGLPIVAPGTTPNPTQAASGRPAPAQQAQDNTQGSANATESTAGQQPTNTLQGMPGSTQAMMDAIDKAIASGADPFSVVPREYRNITQAVIDGQMTLNEIPQTRNDKTRAIVLKLGQQIDPNFSEAMNEARNTYRKQYVSGKATDIGGQVKSINKLAGHANAMADASLGMNNYGAGGAAILAHPLNAMGNQLNSTPAAALKRAADLYTNELSSYVSGKGGSGVEERKQRSEAFSPNATPQEMGQSLLTDIEFLEKQIEGNEQHQQEVFKNTKVGEQFPLVSPQARQQLDQAKTKAHKLLGDYDAWSKTDDGMKALGQSNGWSNFRVGK